ncbi:plexin-C1, partial [Centroberyx affinis]|uniref:plexin-C1 n=1 Tax=Centroberyx affinis TaxID=166261 RepID=UPI003A5C7745
MRLLLLGLLLTLRGEPARCRGGEEEGEDAVTLDGNIRHFAVANNSVYVATEERLHQLSRSLAQVRSLTQRGTVEGGQDPGDGRFQRVSGSDKWNATFSVNTLLPFEENGTLISCGVTECGYCELLDLANISKVLYKENIQVGSLRRRSASVGFLVQVQDSPSRTETYILTAIQQDKDKTTEEDKCFFDVRVARLHDTNNEHMGGIFSDVDGSAHSGIQPEGDVEFVDGFQISSTIYLFSNLPATSKVRLLWLESKGSKTRTFTSMRGASLHLSSGDGAVGAGRSRLLASSVIPGGPPVLWTGVFSVDGDRTNTVLVVFDVSPDRTPGTYEDPDFCSSNCNSNRVKGQPQALRPAAVLFRQSFMTSVLAVRQKAWMVFFIGTGDGQLIKLAVDKAYRTVCPRVLYRADNDRQVSPRMHLDQVDRKHFYVALGNQMKRVPVSRCRTHTGLQACWSAQDPFCGWCGSASSCTFEDECPDSLWLSIPDDASQEKMVSYRVERTSGGQ